MTTIDKKINELIELNDSIVFVEYYSHTNSNMYKINNLYTRYNKETLVLGYVDEGIEKSLDLAIEEITKKKAEFYGENDFNDITTIKV